MKDKLARLECLEPWVSPTTLRQWSRVITGMLASERKSNNVRNITLGGFRGKLANSTKILYYGTALGNNIVGIFPPSFVSSLTGSLFIGRRWSRSHQSRQKNRWDRELFPFKLPATGWSFWQQLDGSQGSASQFTLALEVASRFSIILSVSES